MIPGGQALIWNGKDWIQAWVDATAIGVDYS